MPRLPGVEITKAWRYRSEADRIHYTVEINGRPRHLFVDKDTRGGLYRILDDYLKTFGYTGPASGQSEKENASS